MKKLFNFTKKKKHPSGTPDSGSVLSVGYELKDKDLGKVHKAAAVGDLVKLKQLAKKNDINQLDKENRTALHIACASGHVEVVQFLLESKAKLNLCDNQNRSALMKAVQCQHERCVSILLENHAEPNLVDVNGNTALHLAANIPSMSTAVLLLEHEANINAQNKEAFTPLTVAVREDHIEMAEFLLKEGADVNFVDQDQRSPLMIAAGNGQIGMLRLLLQFNADITLKDTKGWSADDYAVMNGHHPCSLLIIEHGTQRNDGQSLSHQGLTKKKKKTLLGSPYQDVEAGFSLGGPATDKYEHGTNEAGKDFEDNSQSESLSRVSKSAADEWPSSEEDDESILIEKKTQKVNLRKMIASKRGEDSAAEHPSHSNARSGSQEESPEAEDSEEEEDEEEVEEEDEEDEEEVEEEEDEDEEEEEEEEEEEDDEEEEEDDEEGEEEEEEDEEENNVDNCVASVKTNTVEFDDVEKSPVTDVLKIIDSACALKVPCADICDNSQSSPGIVSENKHAPEKDAKTKTPKDTIDRPAGAKTYAIPVALDVEQDCVVSAVRVESKFSDEDESLGKECMWSSEQNQISDKGSTEGPRPHSHAETCSPTEVKEEEFERKMEKNDDDDDDSWSNTQNSGDKVWKESEDEEDNPMGFDCNTVLTNRRYVPEDFVENKDGSSEAENDAEPNKEAFRDERCRSSWDSSLEDSDNDLPKEDEVSEETLNDTKKRHKKNDVQAMDLQSTALHSKFTLPQPREDHQGLRMDYSSSVVPFPKCVLSQPVIDKPVPSMELCSTGTPQSNIRQSKETMDESEWDSSSLNEGQCPEEVDKDKIEKESNDPSPAVSPVLEDENVTKNQSQDNSVNQSIGQLSQMEGKFDSENEKVEDGSWDDGNESGESEMQKTAAEGDVLKDPSTPTNFLSPRLRPLCAIDKVQEVSAADGIEQNECNEDFLQASFDGDYASSEDSKLGEDKLVGVKKYDLSKEDDTSEDSDSKDQKLQYDFASVTVKACDVGNDSEYTLDGSRCAGNKIDDGEKARLTAYVPLENRATLVPQTEVSSRDLNEEPIREKILSCNPNPDDFTVDHGHDSEGNSSDEVLPQTDIDDVDLDSPDEAENIGMGSKGVRNIEELVIQKEHSTDEYDDDDDDNKQEGDSEKEEQGNTSDENDQPEESGDSLNATLPAPEAEVPKDKRRDFLSELGLENGQEEPDSWDSESSENPSMPHEKKQSLRMQDQKEMSTVDEEIKEIGSNNNGDNESEHVDKDDTLQKETEKAKWEPLSVLSKLEGDKDRKMDLMEELGLGDVDDLEDASDWDSASTTSKRTLPGRRMASPVCELPECSQPSVEEQDEDNSQIASLTPQKSINSKKSLPSTPPQPVPHPQPRARRVVLQKPEGEEESEWEPDNVRSSPIMGGNDTQLQNITELQAVVRQGSPELSPMARESQRNVESDNQQEKEKDDSVDSCELDLNNPCPSGHVGSDSEEKNIDVKDEHCSEEGQVGDGIPWEKRYEKLWVEVEKREVKSNFRSVAVELKEKFGELLKSRCPIQDLTEKEQEMADSSSAEESSDEEGEVIVRPTARARSTVLLTIPEQRESGLDDSATESTDKSMSEDRIKGCERPASESSMCQEPDLPTDGEGRSPSLQCSTANQDGSIGHATTALTNDRTIPPVSDIDTLQDEVKPDLDLIWKRNAANLDEAEKNHAKEEDPEEFTKLHSPALIRRLASVPRVSDQELKEDMERFKLEVGMLKVVFLDLEKEKAQLLKEVDEDTTKTAMLVQKSSTSWDFVGTALQEVSTEKPETSLGCLSNQAGAIHQKRQPTATKSTNGTPVQLHLPHQQSYSNNKQETLQLELVRGAQHSRAPQTNTHVNGDPLSVFDDSTLSDVSDDEGRLSTSGQQKNEIQNSEEIEMAEDFDELTQSSDTATDDIDSPTSGYRHASLLIQKLDSATLDSRSMVKLQNIFHEYERSIQKARSRHGYLADKVSQLEIERAELKSSLEEVKDVKSGLERNQLELQTEVTNLKFQLKQEQENRRNANMMYNTARDKLRRTEEQQQFEVQERQKVELTLRNLELEMRTIVNNMKQLEEDHSETQRLLAQERSARTLQENLLTTHLRKQQEIKDENNRNISKSNEALSQLTEASDRERELLQQTAAQQEQLTILRTDLEHSQANSSLRESNLLEENEALKEQLEDARRDLKLNSEALTQTVFNCNNQVTTLKSELAVTTTRLENERQTRETLETEVESTRVRLAGAVKEAELCLAARSDTERALLREKEEHQRLKDRLTGEAATQREAINSLSQKLAKAEAHANSMENEVHRVTLQLTEKGLLLEVLQREKDQAGARVKELEMTLLAERELVSRAGARQEATQERLAQAQSEGMLLRQQLEEAQNKGVAKERAVTDAQERFSDILSKLRSDCEERVQLVEERNKELATKAADLRDQIYKLEEDKNERETSLRQLQQELADSLKKLSMSEASLEVNTRYRNDLEEEKARLLKDLDRLKGKLEESEEQYVQAERRINSLKTIVDEKEKELTTAAQKLQEALSASAASDITIKQLEEAVQRLEIDNARLEATAKQQSNKIDALQKGAQEAAMVRGHLEDLVTNLQSSKMTLEDQLNREVQKQSMLSHTAQDSQALWEEELKSRSKLGLRLSELEKEKGQLNSQGLSVLQMEIEKKKAKKIAEQKKAVDTRLDQEMKRNTELQKEMYRLRTLLKTAKKKLRDQETGGADFVSPISSLRLDLGRHSQAEGTFGRMKDKLDDMQIQLEKEVSRRSQLEQVNGDLKDQLASLKSLNHSDDQLERSKRQLEEEVLDLKRRMEASQMEQSQVEQYRRDAEERARQEIQQKLEQVNLFLQSQAASQEALDHIKAANEANLRSQFEQKIRELEGELGRARTSQQHSLNQRDSTRTDLERYRQLYTEELRLRKSLAAKLERANCRLSEANSKLLNERSRSLITSSIANSSLGGPSLDVGSLGSPVHYGATLGPPSRSLGLGLSFLSPVTEGQNNRVEDYIAKMQSELDRNISKELNNATAELEIASVRMSPVGSASRVELDPTSRATQQYLEVLKKNYMV